MKGQPNIVPSEPEAGLITKSFELVRAGHDRPAEVLRTMTGLGLRSRKGRKLGLTTFLAMLRNPVYIGAMKSKKWGMGKGLHKPIVSDHVFRDVQLIPEGQEAGDGLYIQNREEFPLCRFLRCSECDRPLTGSPSKSNTG